VICWDTAKLIHSKSDVADHCWTCCEQVPQHCPMDSLGELTALPHGLTRGAHSTADPLGELTALTT